MVNTNHRDLTGIALHEPKGAAAANAGESYIADGAGSGTWSADNIPTGGTIMWHTDTAPSGFLECDGSSLNTTTYAALFAVLSYDYGGSGSTFDLPDLRGEFIRGWDNSRGADPAAAGRTSRGDVAATTGDNIGTKQATALTAHTHTGPSHTHPLSGTAAAQALNNASTVARSTSGGITGFSAGPSGSGFPSGTMFFSTLTATASAVTGTATAAGTGATGSAGSGTEARPRNVNVMFVIKI